jgi:hypothetical protein
MIIDLILGILFRFWIENYIRLFSDKLKSNKSPFTRAANVLYSVMIFSSLVMIITVVTLNPPSYFVIGYILHIAVWEIREIQRDIKETLH